MGCTGSSSVEKISDFKRKEITMTVEPSLNSDNAFSLFDQKLFKTVFLRNVSAAAAVAIQNVYIVSLKRSEVEGAVDVTYTISKENTANSLLILTSTMATYIASGGMTRSLNGDGFHNLSANTFKTTVSFSDKSPRASVTVLQISQVIVRCFSPCNMRSFSRRQNCLCCMIFFSNMNLIKTDIFILSQRIVDVIGNKQSNPSIMSDKFDRMSEYSQDKETTEELQYLRTEEKLRAALERKKKANKRTILSFAEGLANERPYKSVLRRESMNPDFIITDAFENVRDSEYLINNDPLKFAEKCTTAIENNLRNISGVDLQSICVMTINPDGPDGILVDYTVNVTLNNVQALMVIIADAVEKGHFRSVLDNKGVCLCLRLIISIMSHCLRLHYCTLLLSWQL